MKNIKPILQNYSSLFFDLDGTLTYSGPGIINSVKYALNYYGIEEKDQEKLKLFIFQKLILNTHNFRTGIGFTIGLKQLMIQL